MAKVILAECIHEDVLRHEEHSNTLYQYIKRILMHEGKDHLGLFGRDAKDVPGYESLLYVEPRELKEKVDYVWEDIKRRTKDIEFRDFTDTDELYGLVADGAKKCIFLLGDIGCGKSTFIDHFRKAYDARAEKPLSIFFDFSPWRDKINSESDYAQMKGECHGEVGEAIADTIQSNGLSEAYYTYVVRNAKHRSFRKYKAILDNHEKINVDQLRKDIESWEEKNQLKSIVLGFRFLRGHGFKVLMLLDNVDPIPISYQESFARDALELSHLADIQVLITLRFYSLDLMANVAGGYRLAIFMRIDLPPIRELIEKRVKYFIFDQMEKSEYNIPWNGITLWISRQRMIEIVNYVNKNLLDDELIGTLICLSDMNIKWILLNYSAVLDTKHVNLTPDIVYSFYQERYKPDHIFTMKSYDLLLKSVITNKGILFTQKGSRVENIFRLYTPVREKRFLNLIKAYLLTIMYRLSVQKAGLENERSFVDKETIIAHAIALGWSRSTINAALRELYFKALLFGYESDSFEFTSRLALSNSGVYHYSRVSLMVYYLFFMFLHFPVEDTKLEGYFSETTDSFGERKYMLRGEDKSLLDDDLVHALVGDFILELADMEKAFMKAALKSPQAIDTYRACIGRPLCIRLIHSYRSHLEKGGKTGFDRVLAALDSVHKDLERECAAVLG
ncbi:MAG: ATP-binding protein [Candidatus Eisenbacteria bacterium]